MAHGRYALENFLRRQPKVLRQPTTLIAASFRQFKVLGDYTQDRDALLGALRRHQPVYPSQLMRTSLTGTGERMAATLASVQEIAVAQAGTPGRKNLVWIGQGFPSINGALLDQDQVDSIDAALRQITNGMLRGRVTLFVADPESTKYRHIRVEVRRAGLQVMTRDGYFPTDSAEPAGPASQSPKAVAAAAKVEKHDIQAELVNAALNPMAYNGIDVHAAKGKGGGYELDVRSVDLNWAPLESGLFHTSVSLFAVGVTAKGKVCANASRQIAGDAPKAPVAGSPARTLLKLPFDVPAGATRIRFVVRDAVTGKIGTADLNVAP